MSDLISVIIPTVQKNINVLLKLLNLLKRDLVVIQDCSNVAKYIPNV